MSGGVLQCPSCNAEWPTTSTSGSVDCPGCHAEFAVDVFPALHRPEPRTAVGGEALVIGDEAGCFYHPEKKAVVPCDSCGRFLCALCDLDIGGAHWCPACLEKGRSAHKVAAVDSQRTSYPDIALLLALLPLILWPITLVTAPTALFVAIRGLKKPASVTGNRKRLRTVLAIVIALVQLAGWAVLIVALIGESLNLFA
jgi:hypothetical protein